MVTGLRGKTAFDQRGAVLILVLWILMLLTVLLAAFSNGIRIETRIAGDMIERIRLRSATTAALNYLAAINAQSADELRALEGGELLLATQSYQAVYTLVPEEAYVSLNAAPAELLKVLISACADGRPESEALADALIDWRDADDIKLPDGAEAEDYAAAGLSHEPRNAPFARIEELRLVKGFDQTLVDCLRPFVSPYSGSPGVEPRFADPQLLAILDPDAAVITKDFLAARNDPEARLEFTAESPFFSTERSGQYRIAVSLLSQEGARRASSIEVVAVLGAGVGFNAPDSQFATGTPPPYSIIYWNEYPEHARIGER